MTALPSVRDVALDPEWIPHALEPDSQHLSSVFVPRAARADLVFLADGHFKGKFAKATFPISALAAEAADAAQAPLHFIFNTSFCCSTLLARALDIPGVAAALREPNILVDLAERLIRADSAQDRASLEICSRLLARPLGPAERVIVKPSNFANRLAEPLLSLRPDSRAVLLYSDASTFFHSLLKRGLLARINARKLYQNLTAWTALDFGFSPAETFEQTDLQIAGLAWLMQIAHFQCLAERFGSARIIVLNSADLLAEPATSLQRIDALFELGLDERRVRNIVSGPVFSKHSKFSDRDFDERAGTREREDVMKVHGEEVAMVVHWLDAVAAHLGVPLQPQTP